MHLKFVYGPVEKKSLALSPAGAALNIHCAIERKIKYERRKYLFAKRIKPTNLIHILLVSLPNIFF